jgi:hypothetical protein
MIPFGWRGTVLLKLTLALLFVAACSMSDSSTGPSASYDVNIIFTPVAPPNDAGFSVQLDGKTYDASGVSTVSVSSGAHQMTGTYRGSGFVVGFATVDLGGGVKSGSVHSVSGPSPKEIACAVTYSSSDTANAQHAFQLAFTVDAKSSGTLCGGPAP